MKDKLELFKKVLAFMEEEKRGKRAVGFCLAFECSGANLEDYPEIMQYKPQKGMSYGDYWFDCHDYDSREKIMKTEIAKLENENIYSDENNSPQELKITAEKVRAMAEKCPTAKDVLKEGFPEAFEEDKYFDFSSKANSPVFGHADKSMIEVATGAVEGTKYEHLRKKCFYLSGAYNWEMVKIDRYTKYNLLIPTRK